MVYTDVQNYEEGGIFTRFLLEGLSGKADKDNNGIVTFDEVARYVEEEVPLYTRKNFSRTQRPTRRYWSRKNTS